MSNVPSNPYESASIKNLMERLAVASGRMGEKRAEEMRKRRAAIGATVDAMIEKMPEQDRVAFFAILEGDATSANRRLIAAHPLREDAVDEVVDAAGADAKASETGSADAQ